MQHNIKYKNRKYILHLLFLIPFSLFSQESQWEIFFEDMQGPIAVDPYNSNVIYIASSVSGETGFWKTTDGGSTWNKYTEGWEMGDPESIYINPTNTYEVFVVGGPFVGVQKSTDAGKTWIRADYGIPTDHHGYDVKQLIYNSTEEIYYLVDGGGGAYCDIYKSEDALQWEWIPLGSGCPTSIILDESNSDLYVGTRNGNLWKSTNGGESWERRDNGIPDATSIWHLGRVKESQTLYAATSDGIYKSKNNGEGWFSVNDTITSQLAFTAGLEVSENDTNVIFTGSRGKMSSDSIYISGIYLSKDGGNSWQQYHKGLPDSAIGFASSTLFLDNNSNSLFAGISMGFENAPGEHHIYQLPDAVITDISERPKKQPGSNLKLQATPNPFNSQTTLVYSIPFDGSITLKIYDILGREVLSLLDNTIEKGNHRLYWYGTNNNGEQVPSGIYLARLEIESNNAENEFEANTLKLILLK